jgi:coenzyme F420-reducing hydrogenase delta subunit
MSVKEVNTNNIPSQEASPAGARGEWDPKILVFACQYCTYAGADLAGLSRLQYPTTTRVLRVPCSGRTNPQFVVRAFQKGFDGVLVAGCHPGDCHFSTGNYFTRRRYLLMTRLMEFIGMDPRRFRVCWISGSEGPKFQQVVTELTEVIRPLGPNTKLLDTDTGCAAASGGNSR